MALALVCFPTLSSEDFSRIQGIRKVHDRLYFDVIDPHIPIVFPTENIEKAEFIEHIGAKIGSIPPFDVVFRCAVVGDPDFQEHAHAFLVPDEGFSDIVRLHDLLYTGPLRTELRLDLPFVPHVGIANTREAKDCKDIVDAINAEAFEIFGKVDQLDVISFDGTSVARLERIELGKNIGSVAKTE